MQAGQYLGYVSDSGFEVVKLLAPTSSGWYVRTHWPLAAQAEFVDVNQLDVRTTCSEWEITDHVVEMAKEAVSQEDQDAITQYQSIRSAKDFRFTHFEQLIATAQAHQKNLEWEDAIWKINEAAPFAKLDTRVYALRAHCFLALNRMAEAAIDIDFLEVLDPKHSELASLKETLQQQKG